MGLFDINIPTPETTDNNAEALYLAQHNEYMRSVKFERLVNWMQLIAAVLGILMAVMYLTKRN